MKKIMTIALAILIMMPMFAAKVNHAVVFDDPETYSSILINVGTSGTKNIKVSGTGKNKDAAMERAAMNAIHSVIFSGIAAATNGEETPKLYKSTEPSVEDQEYFDNFFNNGDYKKFLVQVASPAGKDMSEIKGGIKVKVEIQVKFDLLREKLIQDNIIQGLADALEGASKPILIIFPDDNWCESLGYVKDDDPKKVDYRKALKNTEMMSLIETFQAAMIKQKYDCKMIGDALDVYNDDQFLNEAERVDDGEGNASSMLDMMASAIKADYAIRFYPENKKADGKQFVVFHIRVVDTSTGDPVYTKVAQGTATYGAGQMTNQLKEAILNIQDEFLGTLQTKFNEMATKGRKITIEFKCKDGCPVNFATKYDGYTLEQLIFYYMQTKVQTKGFTASGNTSKSLKYEQVYIPLFIESKNPFTGEVERVNQDAKMFAEDIQKMIEERTGQKCRVFAKTLGKVRLTMGVSNNEE